MNLSLSTTGRRRAALCVAMLFSSLSSTAIAGEDQQLLNMCKACHGVTGESNFVNIPNLKWQNQQYMTEQLHAFKSGQRQDITMSKVAKLLTEEQIELVATYFYQGKQ